MTRQFQIADIARIYGVPPHMIGSIEKSTSWGSGIQDQSIGFVNFTLRPLLNKFEKEFNRKCFRTSRLFCEFSVDGLLEGDSGAQAEYFGKALGGPGAAGWMTQNEVRRLKNMPPLPGGDKLLSPTSGGDPTNEPPAQTAG